MVEYFTTAKSPLDMGPGDITIRWDNERREFHVFRFREPVVVIKAPYHQMFRPEYDAQVNDRKKRVWTPTKRNYL